MLQKLHFILLIYITEQFVYYITNIDHIAVIQIGHIDLTCLHICIMIQPIATSTSQIIAVDAPERNMSPKLYMYAI